MEQQIRFCTTSDGVRIAYATMGQGLAVIRVLGWFTHLEYERKSPAWKFFIDSMVAKHQYVRYDGRGMGLSDRQVDDYSPEAHVRDLEAVVDAIGLERFALVGISQGGPTAITYAVRHPERVSHLILYGSFARAAIPDMDVATKEGQEQFDSMVTLMRHGWGHDLPVFRQMFTSLIIPDGNAEAVHSFNEMQRISTSAQNASALFSAMRDIDVTGLLPLVKVPTLVIHRRGDAIVSFEAGRELATRIPGARLLQLEGRNHVILPDEPATQVMVDAIDAFLSEGADVTSGAPLAPPGGAIHTILFTDIEGSTALTQRLGDVKAREVLREHERTVREALKAHGGFEVKAMGDGFMASFPSTTRAIECAIAIQNALAEKSQSADYPIRVRIGLNAGEPIEEERDLFGTAVIMAARIAAKAVGGQILASDVVRQLAAGKNFTFSDWGETELKGFHAPARLHEVRWQHDDAPAASAPVLSGITALPSIVVLPFANMSGDPEQEYFCDGLAEEIINALTQLSNLKVIARTSAFSFKGQNLDIREIGRKLNVSAVLEGSVRKAGNRLRITAQLVNVGDGYHLWSEKYDRKMEDIFAMQDEITLTIVDRLKVNLLREEKPRLAKRKTVDLDAYDLYLRGRWFYETLTETGIEKAIHYFERTIDKAPHYALGYAGLADCYLLFPFLSLRKPSDVFPKAREATLKALQIDDTLAEGHISLGSIKELCDWDWEGAEREHRRAIELGPGNTNCHLSFAIFLTRMARFGEAITEVKIALQLDPLSAFADFCDGYTLFHARQYEKAEEIFKKILDQNISFPLAHLYLGEMYREQSRYKEALEEYEKQKNTSGAVPLPFMDTVVAIVHARMRKTVEAQKVLDCLIEQSRQMYVPATWLSIVCFALGQDDEGFRWLDEAYNQRDIWLRHIKIEPYYDSIRSDPRYVELLKKMRLDK